MLSMLSKRLAAVFLPPSDKIRRFGIHDFPPCLRGFDNRNDSDNDNGIDNDNDSDNDTTTTIT